MSFTLPFLIHIRYSIVIFKWFYPKPISLLLFISFDLILHFKLHPYLMTIRYPNLKSVCEEFRFLSVKKKNAIEEQRFRSFASVTLCFNWFWVNKENQPWLSQSAPRKFPLHWKLFIPFLASMDSTINVKALLLMLLELWHRWKETDKLCILAAASHSWSLQHMILETNLANDCLNKCKDILVCRCG